MSSDPATMETDTAAAGSGCDDSECETCHVGNVTFGVVDLSELQPGAGPESEAPGAPARALLIALSQALPRSGAVILPPAQPGSGPGAPHPQAGHGFGAPHPQADHGFGAPHPQAGHGFGAPHPQAGHGFGAPHPQAGYGFGAPHPHNGPLQFAQHAGHVQQNAPAPPAHTNTAVVTGSWHPPRQALANDVVSLFGTWSDSAAGTVWSMTADCAGPHRLGAGAPYTTRGNGLLTSVCSQRVPVPGGVVTLSVTTRFAPFGESS